MERRVTRSQTGKLPERIKEEKEDEEKKVRVEKKAPARKTKPAQKRKLPASKAKGKEDAKKSKEEGNVDDAPLGAPAKGKRRKSNKADTEHPAEKNNASDQQEQTKEKKDPMEEFLNKKLDRIDLQAEKRHDILFTMPDSSFWSFDVQNPPNPAFQVGPHDMDIDSDDEDRRITVTRVKSLGLKEEDLHGLDEQLAKNPHYSSAAPMRLYLVSEVQQRIEQIRQRNVEELKQKWHATVKERRTKLMDKGITPSKVRSELYEAVFGDYVTSFRHFLSVSKKTRFSIRKVTHRFVAAILVQRNLSPLLWKESIVVGLANDFKALNKMKTVGDLIQAVQRLFRMSDLITTVLENCADDVFSCLIRSDVNSVVEAYSDLNLSLSAEKLTNKKAFSDRIFENLKRKWPEAKESIKESRHFQTIVSEAYAKPESREMGERAAVERLFDLFGKTEEQRALDLRDALHAVGLVRRSDSSFCTAFEKGTTSSSKDEVVATMYLTKVLHDADVFPFHSKMDSWKQTMLRFVDRKNMSWMDAARQTANTRSLSSSYSDYHARWW